MHLLRMRPLLISTAPQMLMTHNQFAAVPGGRVTWVNWLLPFGSTL